jgi:hypothetical protein
MKRSILVFFLLLICQFSVFAQIPDVDSNKKDIENNFWAWLSFGPGLSGNDALGINLNGNFVINNEYFSVQYINMKENQFDFNIYEPADSRYEINATYGIYNSYKHILASASGGLCYINRTFHEVSGYNDNALFNNEIYNEVTSASWGVTGKMQFLIRTKSFGIGPSLAVSYSEDKSYLSLFLDIAYGFENE